MQWKADTTVGNQTNSQDTGTPSSITKYLQYFTLFTELHCFVMRLYILSDIQISFLASLHYPCWLGDKTFLQYYTRPPTAKMPSLPRSRFDSAKQCNKLKWNMSAQTMHEQL